MGKAIIIRGISFASRNFGKVTPVEIVPLQSLAINSDSTFTGMSLQLSVSYNPSTTTETGVYWEIVSGDTYASIDSNGLLTVDRTANNSSVEVRATSRHNASIVATKTITVTYEYNILRVVPNNITFSFNNGSPITFVLKASGSNYLERMLYATEGTKKLNTISDNSYAPGASSYITDDMYMIDIPDGATGVTVSGDNLYFNTRNIRLTTIDSNFSADTRVENTIASVPSTVNFSSGAKYLYVRISVASAGNDYVLPKLTWLYE